MKNVKQMIDYIVMVEDQSELEKHISIKKKLAFHDIKFLFRNIRRIMTVHDLVWKISS